MGLTWRVRSWVAALVVASVGLTLTVALAGPAQADEVIARSGTGVFTFSGHGFGHGHGMSQWGAYGAANQGVPWTDILSFYYPGTARGLDGNPGIKVRLTVDGSQTRLSPSVGLVLTDATGFRMALPSGVSQWRMVPSLRGFHLEGLTDTWHVYPVNGGTEITTYVRFDNSAQMHRLWRADGSSIDYRGGIIAYPNGSSVTTILQLRIEDYLRGVVPRESVARWPLEALRAQAVAARSYAAYGLTRPLSSIYDICDTTACQVFGGTAAYAAGGTPTVWETTRTDTAVSDTSQVVLTYGGVVALTQFSASNGGWTTDGGLPYLVARPDPWDGTAPRDPVHSWSGQIRATDIEARYPAIGTLRQVVITSRDGNGEWGGRVRTMRLDGDRGSTVITGSDFMNIRPYPSSSDGLRSSWFSLRSDPNPFGHLDSASRVSATTIHATGWAIEPDISAPITVQVWVDGGYAGQVLANTPRPDVGAAYPTYGADHGFDATVSSTPGTHIVCAYAMNAGTGTYNPSLGCYNLAG